MSKLLLLVRKKKLLKKHQKKCIGKYDVSQSICDLTIRSECLSKQLRPIASKTLVNEVFSKMILDEVSNVVNGDTLIIQLGTQWLEKKRGKHFETRCRYIANRAVSWQISLQLMKD